MKLGRVLGIDDGYFVRGRSRRTPLVGVVMKSAVLEGFRLGWITVDGNDATEAITSLVSPLRDQLGIVFLYGTIFAGTNVVDLQELYKELNLPIIVVVDDLPDDERVRRSLLRYGSSLGVYERNPPIRSLTTKRGTVYATFVGVSPTETRRAIEEYQQTSRIPEPLRISHLMGREVGRWILESSGI